MENVDTKLLKLTNQNELRYLSLFTSCCTSLSSATETEGEEAVPQKSVKFGVLLVTTEAIHLTTNFQWLCEANRNNNNNKLSENYVTLTQPMTNLVELEDLTKTSFTLSFMDELENTIEKWKLTFDSYARIAKTLEIIDEIWRKIFCLPLVSEDQIILS